MFDDPRKSLHWMEDELLDEELEDILYGDEEDEEEEYERPRRRGRKQRDFHRAVYEDEDDDEERYMLLPKRKGIKGLVFVAVLETIAILAILGWWLQWLI